MAAMPFLYNGVLLNQVNLPRVNLVFTLKSSKIHYYFARFSIPYFNFLLYYILLYIINNNAKAPKVPPFPAMTLLLVSGFR